MTAARRRLALLRDVHAELAACTSCPDMIGPVVHGPPVFSGVMLLGQAPGPHEGGLGRPFAWTAGKTLFRWFDDAMGLDEAGFRANVYMAAVARCFPGKAKGGGDRVPDKREIEACSRHLAREVEIVRPELVLAVGQLAIGQVLRERAAGKKLDALVGALVRTSWFGLDVDVVPLPHPSGASPWPRIEPGKSLTRRALEIAREHPAMQRVLAGAHA